MAAATGEYIGFLDPDDYVDLDFYEKLYARAAPEKIEVVKGNVLAINMLSGKSKEHWITNKIANSNHISSFSTTFWSAIYRRDFLESNKIDFPAGIITVQDAVFLIRVTLTVCSFARVDDTYYRYFYQRPGSLDSPVMSHAKAVSRYDAFVLMLKHLRDANMPDREFARFAKNNLLMHLEYNLKKQFEVDADRERIFDLATALYDTGLVPHRAFRKKFGREAARAIRRHDYNVFCARSIRAPCSRIYLFGIIPILKIKG
jgi:hypothetical protein